MLGSAWWCSWGGAVGVKKYCRNEDFPGSSILLDVRQSEMDTSERLQRGTLVLGCCVLRTTHEISLPALIWPLAWMATVLFGLPLLRGQRSAGEAVASVREVLELQAGQEVNIYRLVPETDLSREVAEEEKLVVHLPSLPFDCAAVEDALTALEHSELRVERLRESLAALADALATAEAENSDLRQQLAEQTLQKEDVVEEGTPALLWQGMEDAIPKGDRKPDAIPKKDRKAASCASCLAFLQLPSSI